MARKVASDTCEALFESGATGPAAEGPASAGETTVGIGGAADVASPPVVTREASEAPCPEAIQPAAPEGDHGLGVVLNRGSHAEAAPDRLRDQWDTTRPTDQEDAGQRVGCDVRVADRGLERGHRVVNHPPISPSNSARVSCTSLPIPGTHNWQTVVSLRVSLARWTSRRKVAASRRQLTSGGFRNACQASGSSSLRMVPR